MRMDLHVHTNISDSDYSLEETMERARENGVRYLGIVDHDTTAGLKKAISIGEKYGVKVIPGIEISAYDFKRKQKIHILGYNFDLNAANIRKLCDPIIRRRHANCIWQIGNLVENGYSISLEEVKAKARNSTCIYKQHIMAVLMEKGYTDAIYSDLYTALFKNNGICAGDIEYVDAFKAVEAVKQDKGTAILAHPGQSGSFDIIEELREVDLDGLELYHEDHCANDHKRIMEYAFKYNMILSGGSDFHGNYGGRTDIGELSVPPEYVREFL
ncbi:MAG: putative metal-dependent phosphoesterases (PHP family) [Firmicutes bacterium]|nr:putative metal-dependent phosphoesterases (PHP family) [Bacillota bacterium]